MVKTIFKFAENLIELSSLLVEEQITYDDMLILNKHIPIKNKLNHLKDLLSGNKSDDVSIETTVVETDKNNNIITDNLLPASITDIIKDIVLRCNGMETEMVVKMVSNSSLTKDVSIETIRKFINKEIMNNRSRKWDVKNGVIIIK